jgi:rod shape-determining protein MreD
VHAFVVVILTAVTISLQTIISPRLEIGGASPDWLLILVAFLGLYAAAPRAVIAGWFVGLCADLMSLEHLGVMSISYGVAALVLVGVRDYLFRYSAFTQAAVTFFLCLLVWAAWHTYARGLYGPTAGASQVLLIALYTALVAPLVHGILLRAGPWIGVSRRRHGPMGGELGYANV